MCLLIVLSRVDPDAPLVIGANRDERFDRPAVAMTVLSEEAPRILGGRDCMAGGTWLAVNEYGVVAGLTNRPTSTGRDPSKRSRGELPLALAGFADARRAAESAAAWDPCDYNSAWLLVGDRHSLHFVDLAGERSEVSELGPGLHILENRPLGEASAKVERVASLLGDPERLLGRTAVLRLTRALRDHVLPTEQPAGEKRPLAAEAACVHGETYGTRSSMLVRVRREAGSPPEVAYTDGPSCTNPWQDVTAWWWRRPAD